MRLTNVRPEVITALPLPFVVKKPVGAGAGMTRADPRRRAPRRTGALRRSIKVDTELDEQGNGVYRVGGDKRIACYGPMVELGTERTRAQPHLRPAADAYNNGTIQAKVPRKRRSVAEVEAARLRRSERDAAAVERLFGDEG
jgi:HK97 gp10 family phage protein